MRLRLRAGDLAAVEGIMRPRFTRAVGLGSVVAAVAFGPALATPAAAATITCGKVITHSTTLSANIGPCPGDGIVIGADGVTVNLNGHTVSGIAAKGNGGVGARLRGRTGVTLKNGTITGFDAGVTIDGGSGNTVQGLNLHNNISAPDGSSNFGDGVAIGVDVASTNNTVQQNTIVHNGPFEGVGVFRAASTGNRVLQNLIKNQTVPTTLFDGTFVVQDFGINLGHSIEGSNSTTISQNLITDNGGMGILACSFAGDPCVTKHNTITQNDLENNGFIDAQLDRADQLPGSGIRMVDIVDNGVDGPSTRIATRNIVYGNRIVNNAAGGILVSSQRNNLLDNFAFGNLLDLIDISGGDFNPGVPPCDHNVWFGNSYGTAFPDCTTTGGHQIGTGTAQQAQAVKLSLTPVPPPVLPTQTYRGSVG